LIRLLFLLKGELPDQSLILFFFFFFFCGFQSRSDNSKVDSLISRGDDIGFGESSNARSRGKNHSGSSNSATLKVAKLNFPPYGGDEDPTSWICRVEQFFEYQHMEGAAQMWYQLFKESEESISWESLKADTPGVDRQGLKITLVILPNCSKEVL
jgi:hypothetical protein